MGSTCLCTFEPKQTKKEAKDFFSTRLCIFLRTEKAATNFYARPNVQGGPPRGTLKCCKPMGVGVGGRGG